MRKDTLTHVAGHRSLVGSALCRALTRSGYERQPIHTHVELGRFDQAGVRAFFAKNRSEVVIWVGAKVGGSHATATYPTEFIISEFADPEQHHRQRLPQRQ